MYNLAPDISAVDTDYGVALLHQTRGEYWNLNPSGAIVLRAALESADREAAVRALMDEYDVERSVAAADVDDVIKGLLAAGILIRREAAG